MSTWFEAFNINTEHQGSLEFRDPMNIRLFEPGVSDMNELCFFN